MPVHPAHRAGTGRTQIVLFAPQVSGVANMEAFPDGKAKSISTVLFLPGQA